MTKFVKVMYGTTSGAKSDFKYKINKVNISEHWNHTAENIKLEDATKFIGLIE